MGEALKDLGDPLDHHVDPAAVIARQPSQDERERKGEDDADHADGERDPRRIDDAAEHVAPQPVGAEQEQGAALRRADEMERGGYHSPELVAFAAAEEAQRLRLGIVLGVDPLQGFEVALHLEAVDEGPEELALVHEVDALGRREDVLHMPCMQIVWRNPFADRAGKIHQRQEFCKGMETSSLYKMPFGDIKVGMKTYDVTIDLVDGIGTIELGYDVILEGIGTNYNQLTITVQEDKS